MLTIPMRTGKGQNDREHWRARARRVACEKEQVAWYLIKAKTQRPTLPCMVVLTRVAPSNGLDDDNLSGSLKATRDAVAAWLGVDDRKTEVRYAYAQERGPWGVRIEWMPQRVLIDTALPKGAAYIVRAEA